MPPTKNYKKKRETKEAIATRPWAKMAKRVRYLPHYELPKPYQRAKIWHPGDGAGTRATETAKLPDMSKRIRTVIMPSDSGHHPYGPSALEMYSPQHGGCPHVIPHGGTNPMAQAGSLQHEVSVSGDYSRLGGLTHLEDEVKWAREQIDRLYEEGFKDQLFGGAYDRKFDGEEYVETTMGIEGLNFGTVDRLRYSADGMRAIVIDLKFGNWPVTPIHTPHAFGGSNLQLFNYAVYAFFLKEQIPATVTVALIHVKTRTVSTHIYNRRQCYLMKRRIAKIIERAEMVKTKPEIVGFYPNPSNCSWCERINCPARLDLASSIVSLWKKEPIILPRPELLTISTEQLGLLKSFVNTLQQCIDAVNEECKRRAFDQDDVIPGYEIKQRSGKRRIVGADNISAACNLVMSKWPEWFPGVPLDLSKVAMELTELGVNDIEVAAQRAAPKGKVLRAKELVAEVLNTPELVQNNAVYYLAAKIPKQKEI